MARKLLAVEGLTISHSSGSAVSGGTFTITSAPSLKYAVKNVTFKKVYRGTLTFTFTGGSHSSGTSGSATGAGTINFTATKNKIDGQFVLRVEDTGTLTGVYIPPSVPPPTVAFTSNVEISDAGQSKALGE